ncbi:MAG: Ig-like domain repeat protein [Candidatus Latescibacteria bacterium]|nr:Ig-like domain repeat protein [Candidatus Latescibacterota bacterium]
MKRFAAFLVLLLLPATIVLGDPDRGLGGGDNNGGGNKKDTDTELIASPAQAMAGAPVTFTATVTSREDGTPTGTVTFTASNLFSGAAQLVGNVATFTTSALTAGHHVVTARYEGDGTFRDSQGNTDLTVVAGKMAATLALGNLATVYDRRAHAVAVLTEPAGLSGVALTYEGSATPPTNAGSYVVVASLNNAKYEASPVRGTLVIAKAQATLTLGNLSAVYNGKPRPASVRSAPAGLTGITLTYDGGAAAPTNAGSYTVTATLDNANYQAAPATGTLVIAKATARLSFRGLTAVYNGNAQPVIVGSAPAGLSGIVVAYEGNNEPPVNAGSYAVTATLDNPNYAAVPVNGTLVIRKAPARLVVTGLNTVYNGNPQPVTVTTVPAGLAGVVVTYEGSPAAPGDAGRYGVVVTLDNPNYQAPMVRTALVIRKAPAKLVLAGLTTVYNGSPQPIAVATEPEGVAGVSVSYAGSPTAPTDAGRYAVLATLDNPNYQASPVRGTLVISKAPAALSFASLETVYNGSPQLVTALSDPPDLAGVAVSYAGGSAPTNAGSYGVSVTLTNPNYEAPVLRGTLVVLKAPALLLIEGLATVYNGAPQGVRVSTDPAGLAGVAVRYANGATPPTNAGSYAVTATLTNPNYESPETTGTLEIAKVPATLSLSGLSTVYNGAPQGVRVAVAPEGLPGVSVTYGGNVGVPVNAGSYAVVATLTHINYEAPPATGTLVIEPARTSAALTASASLVQLGQPLTLTAVVGVLAPGGGVPTGAVRFLDGATVIGSANLVGGVAPFTTNALGGGMHSLAVQYEGSANFLASGSAAVSVRVNRPPDLSAVRPSVAEIWPPNHKMIDISVLGVSDADGDAFTLRIDQITQDEAINGTGDGDTGPDGAGIGTATAQVRAERAGAAKTPGNGRVYAIWFTAADEAGGAASGKVLVRVPYDQNPKQAPVDDGQRYNSVTGQAVGALAKLLAPVRPTALGLGNYPNPFNPTTAIAYQLPEAGRVRLTIYNALGQQVRVLVEETQEAGLHTVEWNGLDAAGQPAAGGMYFCRLEAGSQSAARKMLFLK